VADLISFLTTYGFNGQAVDEGRSFAVLGSAQFDPSISLRDDVTDPATIGVPFDIEGTPKLPRDLVRSGTTSGLLHTRRSAKAMGSESTGHAVEGGAAWGFVGGNLVLDSRAVSDGDLVADIERGVLVTDFHYTRILDPRTQVVTGLTRNGVWLVEDGRVVRPITNLRFTQSYLEALAPGSVLGASRERELVREGWDAAYLVPWLHLASWNFTGGARG
jgi:predicted Zn-dependent protease